VNLKPLTKPRREAGFVVCGKPVPELLYPAQCGADIYVFALVSSVPHGVEQAFMPAVLPLK
jgi:hypothetical protein